MGRWYGNTESELILICWLWPFSVLFCGFFFFYNKVQFQFSQILESWYEAEYDQKTRLQRLFLHNLQGKCVWSQTWSYLRSFGIWLFPIPSWAVRFTLKLIREIYFTGFPALKGDVYFAGIVWSCWNSDRSWTFPRVPSAEPASCVSCCGAGGALLGGYMVPGRPGVQTAMGPRILALRDLWLRSRLPSH